MSRKLLAAAVASAFSLVSLAAAPSASAALMITNVQVPYFQGITLTSTASSPAGLFDGPIGSTEVIGIAGQIILTTNIGMLGVWCVDLFRSISLGGNYTYTVGALTTDNSSPSLPPGVDFGPNPLTPTQINDIGKLAAYGNFMMSTTPTNAFSAAVQAAIWNVEYGTTATGTAAFNIELSNLMAILPSLSNPGGNQLTSAQNSQGVFVAQGLYQPNQVPEPSMLAMIAIGLLSLLGFGSIRRRANA